MFEIEGENKVLKWVFAIVWLAIIAFTPVWFGFLLLLF